jgi:hypothetical protein
MHGLLMPDMDPFTLEWITNREVLTVNQNSTGNRQIYSRESTRVWIATDPETGDY